ncbi:MAG: PF20097 family protein [Planctomycetota bacterium]
MKRRDPNVHEAIRCPTCGQWMQAGFVQVSEGLLWLRNAEATTVDFAETVPGTNAIMRANRLPAWRCLRCNVLTLQYGRDIQKHLPMGRHVVVPDPAREREAHELNDEDATRDRRR